MTDQAERPWADMTKEERRAYLWPDLSPVAWRPQDRPAIAPADVIRTTADLRPPDRLRDKFSYSE